jgi:hypothetical protein
MKVQGEAERVKSTDLKRTRDLEQSTRQRQIDDGRRSFSVDLPSNFAIQAHSRMSPSITTVPTVCHFPLSLGVHALQDLINRQDKVLIVLI